MYDDVPDIRYSACTIAFKLNSTPGLAYMGVYVYPVDSLNYKDTDFGVLFNEINHWIERGITPFIGGDFNSRMGRL